VPVCHWERWPPDEISGDDPRRTLPDDAEITLRGKPDGEWGRILVEWARALTRREHLMLARRFAAHLQAYANDYEAFWLRRKRRPAADHGVEGTTVNGR
jgi:hypothetical protein